MSTFSILLIVSIVNLCLCLLVFFIVKYVRSYNATKESSQFKLTDKDLILLIENQTDGFISKEFLIKNTALNKSEATIRLQELSYKGIVKTVYSNKFKYFYALRESAKNHKSAELSEIPFLTIEDLFHLFELYDNRLTLQRICLSTGLPLSVIHKELKYFLKQDIILKLTDYQTPYTEYILSENYKTKDLSKLSEQEINLDLSKIVERHKLK